MGLAALGRVVATDAVTAIGTRLTALADTDSHATLGGVALRPGQWTAGCGTAAATTRPVNWATNPDSRRPGGPGRTGPAGWSVAGEEYCNNSTNLRERLLLATARQLAGWVKMPGERECYERFMKEWINN